MIVMAGEGYELGSELRNERVLLSKRVIRLAPSAVTKDELWIKKFWRQAMAASRTPIKYIHSTSVLNSLPAVCFGNVLFHKSRIWLVWTLEKFEPIFIMELMMVHAT